jgi:hypothetical protein
MGLVISKGLTLKSYNTPAAIAGVAPTLDYRFALDRREIEAISLTDKLTYTGATNGTFVNRAGLIERATTDQPRFDHGPASRQSLGLLVEEQRTNSIRNNTMVGAVAGTPGTLPTNWSHANSIGLTTEVVGVGAESGIQYVDLRWHGTATAIQSVLLFEPNTQTAAAQNQTWTSSLFAKIVNGSNTNITAIQWRIVERDSGGTFLGSTDTNIASSISSNNLRGNRATANRTLSNSSVAFVGPVLSLITTNGAAIDITIRIGLPQLEQGAFATSVIPTTTTALTRPVDSAVIDGTGVITGTYTLVEKPAGCAVVNGTNIDLVSGFTAERVMVFPAALSAPQITAIRGAM